ncbi:hypothetical protein SteCoe_26288 [Stentor coeruleus]|uniref:Myb-like DNA-binding domain containing protein n=1 Tax=Stentor coeruleus TaxID=5963 RepID=A0A1R2BD78_9CILI|nr:hypothetical protein SteCoe_26288 [Stentor coeruleus]
MNHNFISAMLQEYALKNLAMLQMQEYLHHFQSSQVPVQPEKELPTSILTPHKGGARDLTWREEEDTILLTYVKNHGPKNWSKIAKKINIEIYTGSDYRRGKHCRERWFNHLDPNLKKSDWTLEEDVLLHDLHHKHGNAWSRIAKCIKGRTENSVRNRWNSLNKKQIKNLINNQEKSEITHNESNKDSQGLIEDTFKLE